MSKAVHDLTTKAYQSAQGQSGDAGGAGAEGAQSGGDGKTVEGDYKVDDDKREA